MHRNRNPCNSFLMVKMASGMDHGRVRLAATNDDDDVAQHGGHLANTKSCSLGLEHISLILYMHITFNWIAGSCQVNLWKTGRPNNIQETSLQSYKTQIKILPFLG